MSQLTFRLVGAPEIVFMIEDLAKQEKVTHSQPQPLDSTSEPLNAPITGGDIVQAAQMITIIFTAGTTAIAFFDKVVDLVRKTGQLIEVRKPGAKGGKSIHPDTDPASITEGLGNV